MKSTCVMVLIYVVSIIFCYPSKPLNSMESSWEAWLFAKQNLTITPRKIIEKSIIVAPTFNPCAEGYIFDMMGRCIPPITINQTQHEIFILMQLNQNYGGNKEASVETPTPGPMKFNLLLPANETDNVGTTAVKVDEPINKTNDEETTLDRTLLQ